MDFTTPYDYLGSYTSIFPINSKQLNQIHFILDFSYTIPELMFKSAEEIFFGAVLFTYRKRDS